MAPLLALSQMELQKYFLSSHNPVDYIPIILDNVASSNNDAGLCGISNAFGNEQHIEIVVLVINLIYFPSTKITPLSFPEFGIDALGLFPPLDVLALEVKKK
jgi:hypothetical protein